jgi:hypothetical protein
MADKFDRFLASALAPSDRLPDRRFVAQVQARIALEDRLGAQHRRVVGALIKQMVALATVAAAVWWVGRAGPVASWLGESPEFGLLILLTGFASLVGILSIRSTPQLARPSVLRTNSIT